MIYWALWGSCPSQISDCWAWCLDFQNHGKCKFYQEEKDSNWKNTVFSASAITTARFCLDSEILQVENYSWSDHTSRSDQLKWEYCQKNEFDNRENQFRSYDFSGKQQVLANARLSGAIGLNDWMNVVDIRFYLLATLWQSRDMKLHSDVFYRKENVTE